MTAILGLNDRGETDWTRMRGMQYAGLAHVTFYRAYANAIMAMFAVRLFMDSISFLWLILWMAGIAAVQYRGAKLDRAMLDADRRTIKRDEIIQQATTPFLSAVMWAIAILFFAPFVSSSELIALLLVVSTLIVGAVLFYTAAPLGSAGFIAIAGLAVIIHLLIRGMWIPAIGMGLFMLICFLGTVEVARVHLMRRLAEASKAEKDEVVSLLLREFEENEADWLWEIDTTRLMRNVSPRFAFALGGIQSEFEGQPLLQKIAGPKWPNGQLPPSLHDLAERLKKRENFSNLLVQVNIRGEERWWELSGTPMRDEKSKFIGFRGVGSDVTVQRESSEKIAYLARFDPLTSLPNRLQLTEALGEALEYAQQWRGRCALLMVDLDRFKSVNDSLGHLTGDKLLAQVSSRLQTLMDQIDIEGAICGRLGGDEFAIVIRDVESSEIVKRLARRVIGALSEPYRVDQHTLYVGASVGSAMGPRDGNTVEELMRNADLALYQAKDIGGGEHCRFEPVLHAAAEERRKLEVSLRGALGRDELTLHYQPVVDAHSEHIVSFEALVRWNSAEHGFVSPAKFIPLAEETRLIVPIGKWVMRKACLEARKWPDKVKVNVNVSPEQLLEPDFHQDVIDALASTGLRPERLEIEVTESIFLRDATVARNALEQVMALGCSVALDDFGTGYSSLGYLRKLRFSTIKVDRSFVQGAAQGSKESLAIINAVVAMAKSMNMSTTAEGVENAEEAELIRSLGCDKIQGYYFGRPMSDADAVRLFSGTNRKIA
jgi:diguanylate cyclase (GGDEF)-like protein/PAS domain S-box-containing protein